MDILPMCPQPDTETNDRGDERPMDKPMISLLITDLDNTLYDWVTFFAHAFYEMVTEAVQILGVSEESLLDELQHVHQRYGNSEYPFALLETRSVADKFRDLDRPELMKVLDRAFHRFNKARHQRLVLYPGVYESLESLHNRDLPIVGHTEATAINALFRLRKLNVAHFLTSLYAQAPEREDQISYIHEITAGKDTPEIHFLDRKERKPNPRIVARICQEAGIPSRQALYVGDSIASDIGMAKEAGAWTAWAEYGTRYDPASWARLVRITHWGPEDFERLRLAKERYGRSLPDAVLHSSFSEVDQYFTFVATHLPERKNDGKEIGRHHAGDPGSVQISEHERRHP